MRLDEALDLMWDVLEVAKYLQWNSEIGKKNAQKIIDSIHAGKYGSNSGMWVQADKAMAHLASIEDRLDELVRHAQDITRRSYE